MTRIDSAHRAIDALLERVLEEQRIVGAVILIFQHGRLFYSKAVGLADREAQRRMTAETVFRLASMTKPIVSVAALALVEAGRLKLDDPVTRFLPGFTPHTGDGQPGDIRIRHLLSHSAGLSYGFLQPEPSAYAAAGISDGVDRPGIDLAENLRRLAGEPLRFAPGTGWHYSLATDVLGAVLEAASEQALPDIVADRVTRPLGMHATRFLADEATPLATPYADSPEPGEPPRRMTDPFDLAQAEAGIVRFSPGRAYDPTAYPSGGAGMIGTAEDYIRFLEALRLGGTPVLTPASVAELTADAVPGCGSDLLGPGWGFGLGVSHLRDPQAANTEMARGSWGWGGVYGTSFWVDPEAALSAVALTNTALEGTNGDFSREIVTAAYAAK